MAEIQFVQIIFLWSEECPVIDWTTSILQCMETSRASGSRDFWHNAAQYIIFTIHRLSFLISTGNKCTVKFNFKWRMSLPGVGGGRRCRFYLAERFIHARRQGRQAWPLYFVFRNTGLMPRGYSYAEPSYGILPPPPTPLSRGSKTRLANSSVKISPHLLFKNL